MCGFIACRKEGLGTTEKIFLRGTDHVSEYEREGWYFYHSLLSITGEVTPQPFIDGDIVCVYNGELYGLPFVKSDGENIIPMYTKYGVDFPRYLRGEFAIALFDFGNRTIVYTTDAFMTKPIYMNAHGVASYASGLKFHSKTIPVNTTVIIDMDTGRMKQQTVHEFKFDQQEVIGYGQWAEAFERAVRIRATKPCYIGLSSGYDSGAIDCALKKIGADYRAYSIRGDENERILSMRNEPMEFNREDFNDMQSYINKHAEDHLYEYYKHVGSVTKDSASVGMAWIHWNAKNAGYRIYLSGQGADEIIDDYSKWPMQSDLKGKFPKDLLNAKGNPWTNFYHGCQSAYLAKEERISGCFSTEGRYPFLDVDVVQAFLNLTTESKNARYKAPIDWYLESNNYPFERNEKIGFSSERGLR